MPNTLIRVIVVDGHRLILDAIRCLLDSAEDMILVGTAPTAPKGHKLACELEPDVAVIEMSQMNLEGHILAQRIIQDVPATNIVALSDDEKRECVQRALEIGAKAYVSKWSPGAQLIQAIRAAAEGGVYIDPAVATALSTRGPAGIATGKSGAALTRREAEVVRLIALGYTAKEIGGQLGIAIKSVATYKARACQKLDLKRRPQLVRFAVAQGWMPQS